MDQAQSALIEGENLWPKQLRQHINEGTVVDPVVDANGQNTW